MSRIRSPREYLEHLKNKSHKPLISKDKTQTASYWTQTKVATFGDPPAVVRYILDQLNHEGRLYVNE